mgnify:CR=1 FL=1|tara:strand:+ start:836 stop:2074 length:1239 start_codon:yes stop_codon:yes gene_type:complete
MGSPYTPLIKPLYAFWTIISISLFLVQTNALIIYNGDNESNQTIGANKADIFQSVGRISNSDVYSTSGSAVRIRGKYLLTANHVPLRSYVTFDNTAFYAIDSSFTPVQVSGIDLKIIKLLEDPNFQDIELYQNVDSEINKTATIIGCGHGRDPNGISNGFWARTINWGDRTTITKRWGTNKVGDPSEVPFIVNNPEYDYLVTRLEKTSNEASLAEYDSGAGLFINDGGVWKLAGIATRIVSTNGPRTSRYSNNNNYKDLNYFVQISQYKDAIENLLPDLDTYEGWAVDNSLYNQNAQANSDSDGDQIYQLMEFALGTDPNLPEPNRLPITYIEADDSENYLKFRFSRAPLPSSVNIYVNSTEDLNTWASSPQDVSLDSLQVDANGLITEIHKRTIPISSAGKAFMRLEIELD